MTVVLATLAAYAFSRMRFRGQKVLFYAVLIALGALSFRFFERPLQRLLRRALPKAE